MATTKSSNSILPNLASNRVRLASCYFAGQSFLGLFWWIGVETSPAFANWFFSIKTVDTDLTTFVLADSFWFVVMSGIASVAIWRKMKIAYSIVWCLVGAIGYAFFCCVGMLFNGGPWLSVGVMCGSWLATLYFANAISVTRRGAISPAGDLESN